jgi:hypothetical protein
MPQAPSKDGVLEQGNCSLVVAKDDRRRGQRIAEFTKELAEENGFVGR